MTPLSISRHIRIITLGSLIGCTLMAGHVLPVSATSLIPGETERAHQVIVEPLFDYPAPPDDIENLRERSEWILTHFWEPMNLKTRATVDQNALNHAFGIYTLAMQWAAPEAVKKSVGALLKTLSGNPALTLQFTKAAEENLYGPRAALWGDEIYADFLRAAVGNKKIDRKRREKYSERLKKIESTLIGAPAPAFSFTKPDGSAAKYFPMATPTVIVFGDPDDADLRLARLRMETSVGFSRFLEAGKANILFILPASAPSDWRIAEDAMPVGVTVGASADAATIYDIKMSPSCYVIDAKGKIAGRNLDLDTAMKTLSQLVE